MKAQTRTLFIKPTAIPAISQCKYMNRVHTRRLKTRTIHLKIVNLGIGVMTVMVGGRKERGVRVAQLLSKFALTVDFFRLMTLTHPDSYGVVPLFLF